MKLFRISPKLFLCCCYSGLLGLAMLLVSYVWLNIKYNLTIEDTFFTWELQLKRMTGLEKFFSTLGNKADITFVDLSGDKKPTPGVGEAGEEFIADQTKLNKLLQLLSQKHEYKFIICDVLLDSDFYIDPLLEKTIKNTPSTLFPYVRDNKSVIKPDPAYITSAYVGYNISQGYFSSAAFLKYKYWDETDEKSLPLRMYEKQSMAPFKKCAFGLLKQNSKLYLNSTLLDLRIRSESSSGPFTSDRLFSIDEFIGGFENGGKSFNNLYINQKYIVIGDFKNDPHPTVLGPMPGPVLLINLYLTLLNGDTRVNVFWVLCMFVSLSFVASFILYPRGHPFFRSLTNLSKSPLGLFFTTQMIIGTMLFLVSFFSYLFSGKEFDILIVLIFLALFETSRKIFELTRKGHAHWKRHGLKKTLKMLAVPEKNENESN